MVSNSVMKSNLKGFISGSGGCREVLQIALPLVLSTSAFTIQMFVDRVFLMWYGSETMSAAMYGGILHFTIFSLFLGTATYVNTFVAQYDGAGQHRRIGASVWQGIYFSATAGLLILAISPLAPTIMNWVGHDPIVQPTATDVIHVFLMLRAHFFAEFDLLVGDIREYIGIGRE